MGTAAAAPGEICDMGVPLPPPSSRLEGEAKALLHHSIAIERKELSETRLTVHALPTIDGVSWILEETARFILIAQLSSIDKCYNFCFLNKVNCHNVYFIQKTLRFSGWCLKLVKYNRIKIYKNARI